MKKFLSLLLLPLVFAGCNITTQNSEEMPLSSNTLSDAEINASVDARIAEYMKSEEFDTAIDEGIQRYIAAQQEDQAAAAAREQEEQNKKAENVKGIVGIDHIYGSDSAKIVLIEYSDFECPFCTRFHETAKEVVDNSGGEVRWVYRHFPLAFHTGAQKKAEASECVAKVAGEDTFWKFADILFEEGSALLVEDLGDRVSTLGVNVSEFQACLDSGEMTERVNADAAEGASFGVTGTPGNILLNTETGEVKVLAGAVPTSVVEAAIEELK